MIRGANSRTPEHSAGLARATILAIELSVRRKRTPMQIEDFVGALCVAARNEVRPYWSRSEQLDQFARKTCGITQAEISFWSKSKSGRVIGEGIFIPYSNALRTVFDRAAICAANAQGARKKPIIGVAHVFAAVVFRPKAKFTRLLLASGFDWRRLVHLTAACTSRTD
jgi:hypothetical protein